MNNPLIQEVRDTREALAAKFDFDLHRIFEDAMKHVVMGSGSISVGACSKVDRDGAKVDFREIWQVNLRLRRSPRRKPERSGG